jgi:hypothetical protein
VLTRLALLPVVLGLLTCSGLADQRYRELTAIKEVRDRADVMFSTFYLTETARALDRIRASGGDLPAYYREVDKLNLVQAKIAELIRAVDLANEGAFDAVRAGDQSNVLLRHSKETANRLLNELRKLGVFIELPKEYRP